MRSRQPRAEAQKDDSSAFSSRRGYANGFDDVAQIAGRIPPGLARLGVAAIVGGANLELVAARRELHRQLPFAERIFAEILAEPGRGPALAAVDRDSDFLDAGAAVEGDALQRGTARLQFRAVGHTGDERAHGEAVDRDRRLRRGAGIDAAARRVRYPVGGLHPEAVEH